MIDTAKKILFTTLTISALMPLSTSFAKENDKTNTPIPPSLSTTNEKTNSTKPEIIKPADLKWSTALENLPQNVEMAVLKGDPSKTGGFTLRMKIPKDFQMQPHFANIDQYITVLTGNVNMGMGDKFDKTTASNLPKETFLVLPASMHHYVWSDEGAIIQISGEGPLKINYVNPSDKPSKTNPSHTASRG